MSRIQTLVLALELLILTLGSGTPASARAAFSTDPLARGFLSSREADARPLVEPGETGPAPWLDGEALEYEVHSTSGETLGGLTLWAEAAELDGIHAWRLEQRNVLGSDPSGYGVRRVLVDQQTLRPLRGSLRHGTLGNADAIYTPGTVAIELATGTIRLDSPRELYDHDQLLYLVRTLPLALGYRTELDLLPLWTSKVIETHLEVVGEGACVVPAGAFDCFEITLGTGRRLWISTGAERYPLQIQDGDSVAELVAIGEIEPWAHTRFALEPLGIAGTLPPAWRTYRPFPGDSVHRASLRILDPNAETTGTLEARVCPFHGCPSLQEITEQEIAEASQRFDGYQLRGETRAPRSIEGQESIAIRSDFIRNGEPWVRHQLFKQAEGKQLELTFHTPARHLEHLQPVFDWIGEHLEVERAMRSSIVARAR